MKPVISAIVMAYNEAASIDDTCREIHGELSRIGDPFELLIIDDGSTDGTSAKADAIAVSLPYCRVVHHAVNSGLGGVYRTGFSAAAGNYVTFFPADGQFPADIIGKFRPMMAEYDMVLGYLPERKGQAFAKFLSKAERCLYAALFGKLPVFQGVMMFRRELPGMFRLKSSGRGWAVVMELIIRVSRAGFRITSVPTGYRPRKSGSSKVNNPRNIIANLLQVIVLRFNI
ncbi:MAG: glycosyltransferase family 2 protein [Candidatus Omnitrophota bacterium]